jgi:hypothetical protein
MERRAMMMATETLLDEHEAVTTLDQFTGHGQIPDGHPKKGGLHA